MLYSTKEYSLNVFLIFIFLFFSFSSVSAYDFYINQTDTDICLYPGGYTYVFNLTEFYNFGAGAIGDGEVSCDSTYQAKYLYWISSGTYETDFVYLDDYYYYYSIPYNSSYPVIYSFGDYLVIESGDYSVYDKPTSQDYIALRHLDSGDWCGTPSYTWVYETGDVVSATYYEDIDIDQSSSCGLSLYPTPEEYGGSPPVPESLFDGVKYAYLLDEEASPSNGTIIDSEDNLNGTLVSASSVVAMINKGYSFDGVNDFIAVDTIPESFYDSDFSISLWINYHNVPTGVDSTPVWFGSVDGGIWIVQTSSQLKATLYDGSEHKVYANNFPTDTWHHVVFTRSKTSGMKLYIDGALNNSLAWNGDANSKSDHTTFGRRWGQTKWVNGTMDEMLFYNRTLNNTEVYDIYELGLSHTGYGGNYSNETEENTTLDISLDSSIPNKNYTFYGNNSILLDSYFSGSDWTRTMIIYFDNHNSSVRAIDIGKGEEFSPYYALYLGVYGGDADNFSIITYYTNTTINVNVFACNSTLDDVCSSPYPWVCNYSEVYEFDGCVNDTFVISINDSVIYPVTRPHQFSLYYPISDFSYQSFSIPYYYDNYVNISLTWWDYGSSANKTLECQFSNGTYSSFNGTLNVSLDCTEYPDYLIIRSNNQSYNTTFYLTASNSNNSLNDYFIVLTGNFSGGDADNVSIEFPLNASSFYDVMPDFNGNAYYTGLFVLIVLIAVTLFMGVLVMIPLHFSKFSIIISLIAIWFVALFLVVGGYLQWFWVIVPVVCLIIYFVIKLFGGGD